MNFADQLARLRVAVATGRLPPDLGRWLLGELVEAAPAAGRRAARDALLRQAARLLPGSAWQRARTLGSALERRCAPAPELRELVDAVLELDPDCPRSARQLFRVVAWRPRRRRRF